MRRLALLTSTVLLTACATSRPDPLLTPPPAVEAATVTPVAAPEPAAKNAQLAAFFVDYDKAELALSPLAKSFRAIKDQDYGNLDQFTDAAAIANRELDQRTAEAMQARFDRASLNADDQLSYDLLLYRNARSASIFPYRRYAYVFDQMNGAQADIAPS